MVNIPEFSSLHLPPFMILQATHAVQRNLPVSSTLATVQLGRWVNTGQCGMVLLCMCPCDSNACCSICSQSPAKLFQKWLHEFLLSVMFSCAADHFWQLWQHVQPGFPRFGCRPVLRRYHRDQCPPHCPCKELLWSLLVHLQHNHI